MITECANDPTHETSYLLHRGNDEFVCLECAVMDQRLRRVYSLYMGAYGTIWADGKPVGCLGPSKVPGVEIEFVFAGTAPVPRLVREGDKI